MYERFTDRARKVMALANQEAQRFNHEYIAPEYILLGIVMESGGIAARVVEKLSIPGDIRLEVERLIKRGPGAGTSSKLPTTPSAKKVIELAIERARVWNHSYVGTEHLLMGLIDEGGSDAFKVLISLGITAERASVAILDLIGQTDKSPSPEVLMEALRAACCRLLEVDDKLTDELASAFIKCAEKTVSARAEAEKQEVTNG